MKLVLASDRDSLVLRARLLAETRAFFASRGVLEVETPALAAAATPELAIESVRVALGVDPARAYYLQSSPEHAMKRLLAAGSGDIYQLCRVFRDGEIGRWHQPEFTLLEWYRVGWDERDLMREVAALLQALLPQRWFARGPTEQSYREAFLEHLDVDPFTEAPLAPALAARGIDVPPGTDRAALCDLALGAAIAPRFGRDALTFVHDFPPAQASLAKLKPGPPPVAARFEVFAGGLELANGFAELTDAAEQRHRFETELDRRRQAGQHTPPLDEAFLAALSSLPECAGVAVGFDRVVALAGGHERLTEALALAHEI